jgi:autotransporter-associated beta strand protein
MGAGTLTLSAVNNYSGPTTISAGTLALSGSGSITNSGSIVVASNAAFDVSGLSSAFTLASALSSQTLSNRAPGAIINGTNDCSAGTLSLVYDGVNPSFTIANGGMTLSALTTINVYNNNTNKLAANTSYKLIAKGTAGLVAGAVNTSAMTVGGNGAAGMATLAITGQELYLNVGASLLPGTGTNIVERYIYDAWGKLLGVYNSAGTKIAQSAIGNRILFQGREYSFKTGLYYFRARWADPVTGSSSTPTAGAKKRETKS